MCVSNQPGRLYTTAKTHKWNLLDEITVENLKSQAKISLVGTCTYNAARKVIASYLKPLCQYKYKIGNTQSFPLLKQQAPFSLDKEY